jgi:phenylacetate-CoA ligase
MTTLHQAFFETLLKTQFLPSDRMLKYQRGLIERLIRHARANVPYYRDQHRLDVLFRPDDSIDWSRWHDVPVLTRTQAQENAKLLYAEVVPPECGEVREGYTAGSTGAPLSFRVNTIAAAAGTALLERGFVWAGLPE